ncbi:hypothetical protein [Baekduia sp.]|uniref:hypothetical protein n=1 Tax=Baekduia sp. TaxID=2600305 RepID=UPI002E022CD5|nr:hypothetical protein [Baekduia sp.]
MSTLHRLVLLAAAALLTLAATAPSTFADEPFGSSTHGTAIVADAGYVVWRADDGRIVVRAGASHAQTALRRNPPASAILDVGARAGGEGAQLIWTEGCSTRSGSCMVRGGQLISSGVVKARVLAHIPYRGGGSPAVAIEGSRLAYAVHGTTGSGKRKSACDVPYVRTLSSHGSSTRKLDRGHCAAISQLDVGDGYVAILAHPAVQYGSGATEARVVKVGGGHSRTLQREAQGEESNFIGAISLDGGALYTARGGIRQANVFTRIRLGSGARTDVRAFVNLAGAFARDGGHDYYAQTVSFESSTECACIIVAGDDPFAVAQRVLAPELSLTAAPQPVYVDSAPSAVATLTRRTVSRTAVVGTAPVAGEQVELLSTNVVSGPVNQRAPVPTGATATTGADGTATIPIPGTPRWRLLLAAATRPIVQGAVSIPTSQNLNITTYVHMTAATTRLPDGRLQVSGTISPAQPGRKVRLDRLLEQVCNQRQYGPVLITPSSVGVPAGCFDRWTQDPVTTATVSADGTSYTLDANAPAGTYRVSLDFAGGAAVYAGETAAVEAP